MYKNILILFIVLGVIFIIVDLVKTETVCPPNKIIYRYIPRTFDEEQNSPAFATDVFKSMFTQPSPWINSVDSIYYRHKEDVNKFFISQF